MNRGLNPPRGVRTGPTWLVVARWMALDARRSRGLVMIIVLFAAAGVAAAALPAVVVGDSLSAEGAVTFLVAPLKLVASLTALLAGYGTIAGPRSGGQLRLLLSLPVDRTALVVGAFIGRAAVVLTGVAVGLTVVSAVLLVLYSGLPLRHLAMFGALLALLVVAVTALSVGLSAAASTRARAAVAVVGAFVLFEFFWGVVPAGVHYLVEGSLPGEVVPGWVVLLERLQPLSAFEATAGHLLPDVQAAVQLSPGGAEAADAAAARPLAKRVAGPTPYYLDPWAGVATLVGWTLAPLAAGWYRFTRADL